MGCWTVKLEVPRKVRGTPEQTGYDRKGAAMTIIVMLSATLLILKIAREVVGLIRDILDREE